MNIAFIGFGNMAKAIAKALSNHPQYQLFASAPSLEEGQTKEGVKTRANNLDIIKTADLIFLAVKPNIAPEVLAEINPSLPKNTLIVSLVAGLSISTIESLCPPKQAIIRAMPNTPIAVGQGATPLIANSRATKQQKDKIFTLFQHTGLATWITKESEMDIFTALSGSGPAYLFLFMEALTKGAVSLGLSETLAEGFTLQTLSGAVALLSETKKTPAELRKKVTSPAGTTASAIAILQQGGFESLIQQAITAAYNRAKELGK